MRVFFKVERTVTDPEEASLRQLRITSFRRGYSGEKVFRLLAPCQNHTFSTICNPAHPACGVFAAF